jgi:hypothetical protein
MLTISKAVAMLPEDDFRTWLNVRYPEYANRWKSLHKGERNRAKKSKGETEEVE